MSDRQVVVITVNVAHCCTRGRRVGGFEEGGDRQVDGVNAVLDAMTRSICMSPPEAYLRLPPQLNACSRSEMRIGTEIDAGYICVFSRACIASLRERDAVAYLSRLVSSQHFICALLWHKLHTLMIFAYICFVMQEWPVDSSDAQTLLKLAGV